MVTMDSLDEALERKVASAIRQLLDTLYAEKEEKVKQRRLSVGDTVAQPAGLVRQRRVFVVREVEDIFIRNGNDLNEKQAGLVKNLVFDWFRQSKKPPLDEVSFQHSLSPINVFEELLRACRSVTNTDYAMVSEKYIPVSSSFTLNLQWHCYPARWQNIKKFRVLCDVLQRRPDSSGECLLLLERVKLQGNGLRREDTQAICNAITAQKNRLVEMNLRQNEVGYYSLEKMLESCQELEILNLCYCKDVSPVQLAHKIKVGTSLTRLDMRGISVQLEEMQVLVDELVKTKITHVSFSGCKLGRKDGSGMLAIRRLFDNPNLKEISLSNNNISKKGTAHIFDALKNNVSLESLDMRDNEVTLSALEDHIIPCLRYRKERWMALEEGRTARLSGEDVEILGDSGEGNGKDGGIGKGSESVSRFSSGLQDVEWDEDSYRKRASGLLALDLRGNRQLYKVGETKKVEPCLDLFELIGPPSEAFNHFGRGDRQMLSPIYHPSLEEGGENERCTLKFHEEQSRDNLMLIRLGAGPEMYFHDLLGLNMHCIGRLSLSKQGMTFLGAKWVEMMYKEMPHLEELDISKNHLRTLPMEILALACREQASSFTLNVNGNSHDDGSKIDCTDIFTVLFFLNTTIVGLPDSQEVDVINRQDTVYHVAVRLFREYEKPVSILKVATMNRTGILQRGRYRATEIVPESSTGSVENETLQAAPGVWKSSLDIEHLTFNAMYANASPLLLNALNEDRRTPLHVACFFGRTRIIGWLIASGAVLNDVVDSYGYYACEMYRYRILRYKSDRSSLKWVDSFGPDPHSLFLNCKDCAEEYLMLYNLNVHEGRRALGMLDGSHVHKQLDYFQLEAHSTVQLVVNSSTLLDDSLPSMNEDTDETDIRNRVDLWNALVRRLNESFVVPSFAGKPERTEYMYLHYAAYKGVPQQVAYVLSKMEHYVYIRNNERRTPIHYAAMGNHVKAMYYLVEKAHELDIRLSSSGVGIGRRGKHIINQFDAYCKTALHYATLNLCNENVQILLRHVHVDPFVRFTAKLDKTHSNAVDTLVDVASVGYTNYHQKKLLTTSRKSKNKKEDESLSIAEAVQQDVKKHKKESAFNCGIAAQDIFNKMNNSPQAQNDAVRVFLNEGKEKSDAVVESLARLGRVRSKRNSFLWKKVVWSFLPYLMFLVVLTAAGPTASGVGWVPESSYQIRRSIEMLLIEEEIKSEQFATTYMDIKNVTDAFDYLKGPFADNLFPQVDSYGTNLNKNEQRYLYQKLRVVGSVRLRSQRVKGDTCNQRPANLVEQSITCYPELYPDNEEESYLNDIQMGWRNNYMVHNYGLFYLWYRDTGYSAFLYPGENLLSTASTSGFTVSNYDKIVAMESGEFLKDQQSRTLHMEFTVYSQVHNTFAFVHMMMEFPATGALVPSYTIQTFKPPLDDTAEVIITFMLEICVVTFSVFHALSELTEVVQFGFTRYITSLWNQWDLAVFFLFSVKWLLQFIGLIIWFVENIELGKDEGTYYYQGMKSLAYVHDWARTIQGYVVILCWLRVVKYMQLMPSLGPVIEAVRVTLIDPKVTTFFALLGVVWWSLSIGSHMVLGSEFHGYSSVPRSILSILRMMLGDFDPTELESQVPVFGTTLWLFVSLFVTLVMLNLLIAVLSEVYEKKWDTNDSNWTKVINAEMVKDLEHARAVNIVYTLCCCKRFRRKGGRLSDLDIERGSSKQMKETSAVSTRESDGRLSMSGVRPRTSTLVSRSSKFSLSNIPMGQEQTGKVKSTRRCPHLLGRFDGEASQAAVETLNLPNPKILPIDMGNFDIWSAPLVSRLAYQRTQMRSSLIDEDDSTDSLMTLIDSQNALDNIRKRGAALSIEEEVAAKGTNEAEASPTVPSGGAAAPPGGFKLQRMQRMQTKGGGLMGIDDGRDGSLMAGDATAQASTEEDGPKDGGDRPIEAKIISDGNDEADESGDEGIQVTTEEEIAEEKEDEYENLDEYDDDEEPGIVSSGRVVVGGRRDGAGMKGPVVALAEIPGRENLPNIVIDLVNAVVGHADYGPYVTEVLIPALLQGMHSGDDDGGRRDAPQNLDGLAEGVLERDVQLHLDIVNRLEREIEDSPSARQKLPCAEDYELVALKSLEDLRSLLAQCPRFDLEADSQQEEILVTLDGDHRWYKPLSALYREVANGRSELKKCVKMGSNPLHRGHITRHTSIVRLSILRDGMQLMQTHQAAGKAFQREFTIPSIPFDDGDDPVTRAYEWLRSSFSDQIRRVGASAIEMVPNSYQQATEIDSTGAETHFPGIPTVYTVHKMSFRIRGLPSGAFYTNRKNSTGAPERVRWDWYRDSHQRSIVELSRTGRGPFHQIRVMRQAFSRLHDADGDDATSAGSPTTQEYSRLIALPKLVDSSITEVGQGSHSNMRWVYPRPKPVQPEPSMPASTKTAEISPPDSPVPEEALADMIIVNEGEITLEPRNDKEAKSPEEEITPGMMKPPPEPKVTKFGGDQKTDPQEGTLIIPRRMELKALTPTIGSNKDGALVANPVRPLGKLASLGGNGALQQRAGVLGTLSVGSATPVQVLPTPPAEQRSRSPRPIITPLKPGLNQRSGLTNLSGSVDRSILMAQGGEGWDDDMSSRQDSDVDDQ